MLHFVLFSIFGTVCVAGAVNLLAQRHPINSALSLVVVMGSLAGEYLLLGAEFVAAVQVIVYAGAIMVLKNGRAAAELRCCLESPDCWSAAS